jgi:hypothetical protein
LKIGVVLLPNPLESKGTGRALGKLANSLRSDKPASSNPPGHRLERVLAEGGCTAVGLAHVPYAAGVGSASV